MTFVSGNSARVAIKVDVNNGKSPGHHGRGLTVFLVLTWKTRGWGAGQGFEPQLADPESPFSRPWAFAGVQNPCIHAGFAVPPSTNIRRRSSTWLQFGYIWLQEMRRHTHRLCARVCGNVCI